MAADELDQSSVTPHPNDLCENQHHHQGGESISEMAPLTPESCRKIVEEATARMDPEVQTAPGAVVLTRLADINMELATRLAGGGLIRAMILGGVRGRTAHNDGGGAGSEHEELLQLVSLMIQLSSTPARSELTYASPRTRL